MDERYAELALYTGRFYAKQEWLPSEITGGRANEMIRHIITQARRWRIEVFSGGLTENEDQAILLINHAKRAIPNSKGIFSPYDLWRG